VNLSPVLDTAIALVFIFLALSLVAIAVTEFIARIISLRSRTLTRGLKELLDDPDMVLVKDLYGHPLIKGLQGMEKKWLFWGEQSPAGIPSRVFAQALIQLLGQQGKNAPAASVPTAPVPGAPVAAVPQYGPLHKDFLVGLENSKSTVLQALRPLVEEAKDDLAKVREKLESWFDQSTRSLTQYYRNYTKIIALVVGIALAIAFNADTFYMANRLWHDSGMRSAIVARAGAVEGAPFDTTFTPTTPAESAVVGILKVHLNKKGRDVISQMDSLSLPLGGKRVPWPKTDANRVRNIVIRLLGWLITGAAVSMGAPFWYDLLQRMVGLRTSAKSKEKAEA
jgi:hypothetical protein